MSESRLFFVSGVSGVGKSSVLPHLQRLLSKKEFDVRDFDERGVPDGGGDAWIKAETEHWLKIATENARNGLSTIICGFSDPAQVAELRKSDQPRVLFMLLDAPPEVIRERILRKYSSEEKAAELMRMAGMDVQEFARKMALDASFIRSKFEVFGASIIQTGSHTPKEVASLIFEVIRAQV